MRNRVLLIALTVGAWLFLKALDYVVPGPELLFLLAIIIVIMITHSLWLLAAQRRWQKGGTARRARVSASATDSGDSWEPWVDIMISAKNEARVIEACVRNMFKVDYPKFLVWIIDDGSTDDMPVILERLKGEFPRLRVHRKSG